MGTAANPRGDGGTKKLQLHQGQMQGGDIGKKKLQAAYSSKTQSTKLHKALVHYLENVFEAVHTDHILKQWPLQHVRQHRFAYGIVGVNVNVSFSQVLYQMACFYDTS